MRYPHTMSSQKCLSTSTNCRTIYGAGRPFLISVTSQSGSTNSSSDLILARPTWIESKIYQTLAQHPDLSSSLLLLRSPDSSQVLAIYPVSVLAANCNLRIDRRSCQVRMNIRRCIPDTQAEVYVVIGRTTSCKARNVVKMVVDTARDLVGGKKAEKRSTFWDGMGVCTWESLGKEGTCADMDETHGRSWTADA